eukprot:2110299-Ditylum_brightwellii.AAC.1
MAFNFHMLEIVGFADDAFDTNILLDELRGLCGEEGSKKQNYDDEISLSTIEEELSDLSSSLPNQPSENTLHPKAKHYRIFIFSTWEKNAKPIRFVCA